MSEVDSTQLINTIRNRPTRPRSAARITNEEARSIAELLGEYTDKIREMGTKIDQHKRRGWTRFITGLLAVFVVTAIQYYGYPKFQAKPSTVDQRILLDVATVVAAIGCVANALVLHISDQNRRRMMEEDAFTLAEQLRQVVFKGSELLEYSRLSFVEQLDLRLRVTDAEGSLRLLSLIVGRKFEAQRREPLNNQIDDLSPSKTAQLKERSKRYLNLHQEVLEHQRQVQQMVGTHEDV